MPTQVIDFNKEEDAGDGRGVSTEKGSASGKTLVAVESGIKECPVCHARCFSDMEVCYGCLHSFEEAEEAASVVRVGSDTDAKPEATPHRGDQSCEKDEVSSIVVPIPSEPPMGGAGGGVGKPRLDQVLEVVISIQVARNAIARAQAQTNKAPAE